MGAVARAREGTGAGGRPRLRGRSPAPLSTTSTRPRCCGRCVCGCGGWCGGWVGGWCVGAVCARVGAAAASCWASGLQAARHWRLMVAQCPQRARAGSHMRQHAHTRTVVHHVYHVCVPSGEAPSACCAAHRGTRHWQHYMAINATGLYQCMYTRKCLWCRCWLTPSAAPRSCPPQVACAVPTSSTPQPTLAGYLPPSTPPVPSLELQAGNPGGAAWEGREEDADDGLFRLTRVGTHGPAHTCLGLGPTKRHCAALRYANSCRCGSGRAGGGGGRQRQCFPVPRRCSQQRLQAGARCLLLPWTEDNDQRQFEGAGHVGVSGISASIATVIVFIKTSSHHMCMLIGAGDQCGGHRAEAAASEGPRP